MILDTQKSTLKDDIFAKSAQGQPLQSLVAGNDWQEVAKYYNAASATNVWRPDVQRKDVFGAIAWKFLTLQGAPDGTQAYANRVLACQSMQMNVDLLLGKGGESLPGDSASYRQGWQDALSAVPSGAGGAAQDAGWPAVRDVLRRPGTRFEVLFSVVEGAANKSTAFGQIVDGNDCLSAYTS